MRTLTKLLTIAAVLTLSVGAFAHIQSNKGEYGFMHSMMNTENPQYKAMLEMHGDPQAMQAWMQNMHDNPQAMQEWMEKIHGENFTNSKGGYGCFGSRFENSDAKNDSN